MNIMIPDITITSLETISVFHIVTGDFRFMLDELQNTTIAQSEEKTDITGKQGRKLNSLKRNKAVTVSGANGLVSAGLLEVQTGGKFETKETTVKWTDYVTVTGNAATTNYTAVGTAGAEIDGLFVHKADGTLGMELTQDAQAGEGKFAYDPATKGLTFADGAIADGTEIVVFYSRKISGSVLENDSGVYSEKGQIYIDAIGEDNCGNVFRVQIYIPKGDFDGNFELAMGDAQTVHNFNIEALAGGCGAAGGNFFTYTIFGNEAEDVA